MFGNGFFNPPDKLSEMRKDDLVMKKLDEIAEINRCMNETRKQLMELREKLDYFELRKKHLEIEIEKIEF